MDRRHEKRQRRAHRQAKRTRDHAGPPTRDQALGGLAQGLDEPHPLTFLAHTSGLWAVMSMPDPDGERLDPIEFVQSIIDVSAPETTALLIALRHFTDDALLAQRIGRELAARAHRVPTWLADLNRVVVARVARQTEPFGDGDQYWVELRWPDGTTLTLAALVDANWGQAFKDFMAVPESIAAIEDVIALRADPDDGIVFEPMDPADVRAQVSEAVAHSDLFFPPLQTESWPQARPLLDWALSLLPEGGAGLPEHDLEESARQAVVDAFMTSPEAAGLGEYAAPTVDSLVWFAGFNCGDPLRWSPTKLDHLLLDWWHRKIIQGEDADRALPDILRAFVRWSGQRSGLAAFRIDENLAAIDRFEPEFLAEIGTPRRDTAHELALAAAGLPLDDEWEDEDDTPTTLDDVLASMVGLPALEALDTRPLPDEPFDESGIEPDILPAVRAALADVESEIGARGVPSALELVTAARRMVRRMARNDPAAWRRRANPSSTACAIAYLLYDMNLLLRSEVLVKDLTIGFGLKSAPQSRIDTFRRALRLGGARGEATLMTSECRRHVLDLRERWKEHW